MQLEILHVGDEIPSWVPENAKREILGYLDPEWGWGGALVYDLGDSKGTVWEADGGEPEDATFARDWAWVPGAIEDAYNAGLKRGQNE